MKRGLPAAGLLIAALIMAACSHSTGRIERLVFHTRTGTVTTAGMNVADTAGERARGLQGVTALEPNAGMVFEFPAPTRQPFWMRGTKIPLSIAFWNSNNRIVGIIDMNPCTGNPCPTFAPKADYRAAVEMQRGWFLAHGVEVGDHVSLAA